MEQGDKSALVLQGTLCIFIEDCDWSQYYIGIRSFNEESDMPIGDPYLDNNHGLRAAPTEAVKSSVAQATVEF